LVAAARRELASGLAVGRPADLWQSLCGAAFAGDVGLLEAEHKRAASGGCVAKLKACMRGGMGGLAEVRCGLYGDTLVHRAADGNQPRMIQYLARGVRVNFANKLGATPLHAAAKRCHRESVHALLVAAAQSTAVKAAMLLTYLPHASSPRRWRESLRVNHQDNFGDTALHAAARCGDLAIWEELVEYGALGDIRNRLGVAPEDVKAQLEAVLQNTSTVDASKADGADCVCCICWFGANTTGVGALVATRCGHHFHERCLVQAVGIRQDCAVCRQRLMD